MPEAPFAVGVGYQQDIANFVLSYVETQDDGTQRPQTEVADAVYLNGARVHTTGMEVECQDMMLREEDVGVGRVSKSKVHAFLVPDVSWTWEGGEPVVVEQE